MNEKDFANNSDLLGMIGSVACLVHCIAMPIIIGFYSASSAHHHHTSGWDIFFIVLCLVAVFFSSRNHHTAPLIKIFLWTSFVLFASGILLTSVAHGFEYLSYLGSLGLVATHWVNYRICQKAH